jgi:acyl-CoA dehydrogenase
LARRKSISPDNLYPQVFDAPVPSVGVSEYLADPFTRLLVDFFHSKGLVVLKKEDQKEHWYGDWIDYQSAHGLYASLLSPAEYSSRGHHFNLRRLTRFLEVFTYYSPAHAYSLHVSFLGLFPILQSENESLKREAVQRLEAGGLFAFAVSEREHGSDLLATEFKLEGSDSGELHASGSKYYIGNVNVAGIVTVLARRSGPGMAARRAPFVFFALRPRDTPAFEFVRKIRTLGIRTAYVGEFKVSGQAVPEADVISEGRDAWEAVFGAVDFGKFFLGFGAVGICERAFAEAIGHMRSRKLYGKTVTDMPHIRSTLTGAFARLVAMKLYACRALDYLQVAGPDERRYLLFNAVQKARVSTEGVKTLLLLSECIGARGFEADTFFETAFREAPMIPGLEGSTHINFRLTAQFIENYFAGLAGRPPPPSVTLSSDPPPENSYWFGRHDRHTKSVEFANWDIAYKALRAIPNVRNFVGQVRAFQRLFVGDARPMDLAGDAALSVAIGRCFSTIVYGQLVAENCAIAQVPAAVVAIIFRELVRDLTEEAIHLTALFPLGSAARKELKAMMRVPWGSLEEIEPAFEFLLARYP